MTEVIFKHVKWGWWLLAGSMAAVLIIQGVEQMVGCVQ